ncbi:MAG: 7TM diverse intracellular signaling domain-containing protein [Granulosicoccus sp.]
MLSDSDQIHKFNTESTGGLAHRNYWISLLFVLMVGAFWISHYQAEDTSDKVLSIQSLAYLEDIDRTKSTADVLQERHSFTSTSDDSLNFGLTHSAYWIWISVEKPDESTPSVLVEVGYPHLDLLDVYQVDNNRAQLRYQLGDTVPFGTRPVKDRMFLIPVHFEGENQSADVLLRVESEGTIQLPLSVKTQKQFQSHVRNEQLVLGLYYGILLGVLAYNFLLAVGLKEPVIVYYCSYAVCQSLFQFTQNGLAFEYFWPGWVQLNQISIVLLACLSLLLSTRFTHLFLNITRENSPKLFAAFRVAEYVFAILAISTLFFDRMLMIKLVAVACSLGGSFMFVTALVIYMRGDQNARFYLMAWSLLIFGVIIYASKALGLLPENFFTVHAVQIGSVIEMILLSYALADRFNRLRDENIKVQNEAKATLEKHVEHRTKELNVTLQKLKQANNQLESVNQRDPLTNIYNRGYFNQKLGDIWATTSCANQPVSLMMIDIDHFKSINDTKGHLTGDHVIIEVANTIADLCNNTQCIAARFGGEEFVVLMPGFDDDRTLCIAEQLRKDVEALTFSVGKPAPYVKNTEHKKAEDVQDEIFGITISVGISTITSDPSSTLSGLHLVDQADKALYNAKQSGRNRCCVYHQDDTHIGRAA